MTYSISSFSNLLYNPLCENPMIETYPKLLEIVSEEWRDEEDLDMILRFVIMVHDPKSILVINEKDLNYRKQIAVDLIGAGKANETYIEELINYKNKMVLDLSVNYMRRFGRSVEWSAIIAYEFKLWENIRELLTPIEGDTNKERLEAAQKKSVVSGEIDADIKRLEIYYKTFFGNDTAFETSAKENMRPESVAKKKRRYV